MIIFLQMSSLLEHLDLLQVDCLNERHDHDLRSLVSARKINDNDSPLYLESDADAQLLLTLTVRIVSSRLVSHACMHR